VTTAIEVRGLDFSYERAKAPVLRDFSICIESGWRCILVGANGAGKTTLLRVLGGKHLVAKDKVRVLGRPAFHDTSLSDEVELLGGVFPFTEDIRVGALADGVMGVDPARKQRLMQVLEIDRDWHMHTVSDGQRRRVQVLLGMLRPSKVLLLDEVTTDLDVVARQELLDFLVEENQAQGTTIMYATHIFDGMEPWATHIAYIRQGRLVTLCPIDELRELQAQRAQGSTAPLLRVVLDWLLAERD